SWLRPLLASRDDCERRRGQVRFRPPQKRRYSEAILLDRRLLFRHHLRERCEEGRAVGCPQHLAQQLVVVDLLGGQICQLACSLLAPSVLGSLLLALSL